jgi:hypothetical protein
MHFNFIEIGTSDFDTCIHGADDETVGLSIEPVKKYFNNLPNKKNVIKLNAVILDGTVTSAKIYYLNETTLKRFPYWARGCNTVNDIHPIIKKHLREMNLDPETSITVDVVKAYSLREVIEMYNVTSLDYLKIDTEGYDCYIMEQYYECILKNEKLKSKKIMFETNENSDSIFIKKIKNMFFGIGYRQIGEIDKSGNSWPNTILSL